MSGQIIEAQEGRAISVVDEALGNDATPPVITEIGATGKRGIPVLIAPLQSQQSDARARGATAQEMSTGFQGFLLLEKNDDDDPRKKWFKKMSGWLMVLANLVVSVTYQAGLNPPGGFWQDNSDGHHAGEPVLHDVHWSRYILFYYFNATAFVTSLVIMVLLMSERFYHTEAEVAALLLTMLIDILSLVGAYVAGTSRFLASNITSSSSPASPLLGLSTSESMCDL
ncbi:hypothetical protein C2845_PM10G11000 [Panicum miliaceum]|uniref:PGG domain-containing protein n=1 Tax=Panicum miliaceum TaxID=4540 RepID=A0A3L6PAM1_PANMI|nr:hypothetical protein C2845_PM10G11000 [Panicum miliaceum]